MSRLLCTICFLVSIAALPLSAEIRTDDHLFAQGAGARTMSLGNTFTGMADDLNAVFYNPAGIAHLNGLHLLGLNSKRLIDLDASTFLSAWSFGDAGTMAFGTTALAVPSIPLAGYDPVADEYYVAGEASYEERVWVLSYAKALSRDLSTGANLKYYKYGFDAGVAGYSSTSAMGFDLDIGLLWKLDRQLSLGLAWQDVAGALRGGGLEWSTGAIERFNGGPRLGLAYKWSWFGSHIEPLTIVLDEEFTELYPARTHLGFEWVFMGALALRTGFEEKLLDNYGRVRFDNSYGIGLSFMGISVDYAYCPNYGESLDTKQFISVSGMFDLTPQIAASKTNPTAYQPKQDLKEVEELIKNTAEHDILGPTY